MVDLPKLNKTTPNKDAITNETNIKDITFTFIQSISARDKYDIEVSIGKDINGIKKKLKKSGSGVKILSDEDKKGFALVQRFNAFIELENDINKQIHKGIPFIGTINTNSSTLKSLTDFEMESKKFKNFVEFRQHTEFYINKLLNPTIPYTLETFSEYITTKANNAKINLKVSSLTNNYPTLIKQ